MTLSDTLLVICGDSGTSHVAVCSTLTLLIFINDLP